jgi:hypothetical protein
MSTLSSCIRLFGAAVFLMNCKACADSEGDDYCTNDDQCWNTQSTHALGRCYPKVVACIDRRCLSTCTDLCEVVDATINPCVDSRRICNQAPANVSATAFCTPLRPSCRDAVDCPIYRPVVDGEQHEWSCESGFCTYPGVEFPWDPQRE